MDRGLFVPSKSKEPESITAQPFCKKTFAICCSRCDCLRSLAIQPISKATSTVNTNIVRSEKRNQRRAVQVRSWVSRVLLASQLLRIVRYVTNLILWTVEFSAHESKSDVRTEQNGVCSASGYAARESGVEWAELITRNYLTAGRWFSEPLSLRPSPRGVRSFA